MKIVVKFTNNMLVGLYTTLVLLGVSSLWDIGVTKARWTFYPLPFSNDQTWAIPRDLAVVAFIVMILAGLAIRKMMLVSSWKAFWFSSILVLVGAGLLVVLALSKDDTYMYLIPVFGYIRKNIFGDIGTAIASLGLFISWMV